MITLAQIPSGHVNRTLIFINVVVAIVYLSWWFQFDQAKNIWLYSLLFFGEIYHVIMALTFWFTIRPNTSAAQVFTKPKTFQELPDVDVFITVVNEPVAVVEKTVLAALQMEYPTEKKHIFLLNDGYVAQYAHWQDMEDLSQRMGVTCITRKESGGAKAGNINNALRNTTSEFVLIFDADMEAQPQFLTRVMPYFDDEKIAFVQTPQYYLNHADNEVSGAAWEQQVLFFGPIMEGKNNSNAAFICGTNVVIRRTALEQVGGMREDNIAEDFLTSLDIHQLGWKSVYHSEVLAVGLAPHTLLAYFKQQLRWARGSLEVLFASNPMLKKLTWQQKIEYLSSALYYANGFIILIDIVVPLFFLFGGIEPVSTSTAGFALLFIPFMLLNFITLYIAAGRVLSYRALSFSQSSWALQLMALFSVITHQNIAFAVTPKQAEAGNFISLVIPHMMYITLAFTGSIVAIYSWGLTPAVATNICWVTFNSLLFLPFIYSAFTWKMPEFLHSSRGLFATSYRDEN